MSNLRDHGLPNSNQPIGHAPQWKLYEPSAGVRRHCPHCMAQLARVEVVVANPQVQGGRGTCAYLGCPACPWAGPAFTASNPATIQAVDDSINEIALALSGADGGRLKRNQIRRLLTERQSPDHAGLLPVIEQVKAFDVRGSSFRLVQPPPPTGIPPYWKRAEPIDGLDPVCGNPECQSWVCEILVSPATATIPDALTEAISGQIGSNWTARYLGCPACPWMSPSLAVQQPEAIA